MSNPILPTLKPIPIKDRISTLFLEKGNLDDTARLNVVRMFPTGVGMNRL